ncbi:DegT/DnrJ/EryC1/StrS family aminotransferase [Bradyrhizobium sp. LHD-71]|uniref:DegT/DnrJ/EryC1/StrS family aminotransferase n=1 Tax=Bradyrhizobium sp. LHD-71 TaxID=3072141 RepID=UPI00280CEB5B|nr:DegT/DnrJ/EryC1/StrS family aminotransferase [Bradyrhizobium sp. LHD-71]MDQ8729107.1 DegT/DnrJ/EryC1/StrS family aminotransferase [Bradyrhizobium sp. LHD-71]
MTEYIPYAGPSVSELEVAYVAEAARDAWYRGAYTFTRRFEQSFADYVGVRHAIAVPHCTSALHLALLALGIKEGDEVIVPECSWIASAAIITYVGAQPVFADIDPTTWCISPESIERLVTPKTRAVIPVGLYGLPADMPAIRKIAEKFKIHVIEDAAQSLGGKHSGKMSGSAADVAAFSFGGTKTLTTGEGGMFVTDDEAIFERAQFLRDHGRSRANYKNFLNTEVAYKYRMSDLQAAFGLAQLERIDELLAKKRRIFEWYRMRLGDVPGLALNAEPPEFVNSYWMTTVVLDPSIGLTTADVRSRFEEYGLDVRPFFHPMSSLPAFAGYPKVEEAQKGNSVAYSISPRAFNLPSALELSEAQVDRVCDLLKTFLKTAGRSSKLPSPSAIPDWPMTARAKVRSVG